MNELVKTIVFVAAAALVGLVAVSSHFMNRPNNAADFELVGKPFFEEFTSAKQAKNLEVVAVDPESARMQRFSVQNKDGLWRIPSHYDYPAEAADRLATTATSVMGIHRDSLVGRLANEHEKLGVVDPLSDDIEDPESVGKRITMKDGDGEVVVDYIIGKEVDQEVVLSRTERPFGNDGNEKYYYIRRPDEQQTYKVKLDIDLSTKFSDWIDPDLLRLEQNDLTRIAIDNYSIEEDRSANPGNGMTALYKAQGDKIEFSRKSSTDPWELDGLQPVIEELDTSKLTELIGVIDQMKIVGVRPKFKYKNHLLLTADLQLNRQPEFEANPQEFAQAIARLQDELDEKGFNLAGNAKKMELVSQQGEMQLGTDKGIVYTLHIGRAVEGDEKAIEIGSSSADKADASDKQPETDDADQPSADGNTGDQKTAADDPLADAKNRYLMIRVSFDESLINPKPVKPVEPVEPVIPEGYQPPSDDKPKNQDEEVPEDVQKPGETVDEKTEQDEKPARNPEFVKYDEAKKQFEQQKIEFELAKTRFADETKQLEEKITEARKLVADLNERFGDWYYVISADNLKTLQSERKDLVTTKQPPKAQPQIMPPRPDISFPGLPGANPGVPPGPIPPSEDKPKTGPEGTDKGPDKDNSGETTTKPPEANKPKDSSKGEDPAKPADSVKEKEAVKDPKGGADGDMEKGDSKATRGKQQSENQKQGDAGQKKEGTGQNKEAGSDPDKNENPTSTVP